ncbi:MAG: hypothetical protein HY092_00180 [Candidatus Kerfeldbacteria bacterium]|nr:hypothetical protein [Candidatus Kerfeldbacteria bacterium]
MKKRQRFGHQESNHAFGRWWAAFFTSAFPARPTAKIDWPTLPKLLSLGQTARLLGVHPNTLRGWDHKGKLTAVRIGQRRDRRFEKGVVLSFWQRTHGQMEKKRAPNHHWLGQPQIRGPIRIGLAFAFLLMVGSTWIGFRPAQAGNSKTLVTLMPTECHGWTGAQNAETIQLPVSATDHEFTEQNSAVFRAASNRVQSQGPGLTSGSLDAVSNVLTCSHFAADGLSPGTNLSDGVVHLSFRGKFSPNSPDSVTIDASLDGRTWVPIKTVPDSGTGALGGPVTLSTELSKHLSTIQIRLVADVDIASVTTLWLDGIGITATPILPPSKANVPEKQAQLDRLTAFSQASYDASRQPLLTLPTRRPHKNALFVTTSYDEWQLEAVKVFDSHGTEYAAKYVATETRDGSSANLNIKLDTYRLHPGKYVVHLQVRDPDGQVETISKVFLWGVVALNFRQATINVGSQESIGVGVLDDEGRTLCGANLLVKITDPRGGVRSNTTGDHSVAVNKHCIDKGVTNEPDYAFGYTPAIPGLYYVHLEAKTPAGKRSLDETFQAAPSQKFEVDRVEYPTRIYPPAAYPTRMAITPHRDYLGIVTERVPSDFALSHILAGGTIQPDPDDDHQQIVSWPVEWQKDKTYYLGYTFQAPDISPALFQTGPMQIGGGITLEPDFAERRQWQIASDANGDPAKVMHGVLQAPSSLRGQVVTSLQASKTLFRSEDSPSFVLPPSNDPVRGPIKRVRLIDAFSQPSDVHLADRTAADVPRQLVIDRSNGFHPGRYTVEVTYDSQQPTPVVDTQTFVWGVLVVNTEKSVYRPGETARFDMTTLDATGKTLCESDLTLEVTSPSGQKTTLSTGDGSIVRNYTCDDHSVTDNPDYSAQYVVAEAGAYQLHMTSVQTAGQARTGASDSFSIDDSFEVRNQVPFDISRAGTATRLYPVADYTARFSIVANQDYQGTVTETAPQSFRLYQISDGGAVVPTLDPEQQTVGWTVDWKAGQTYTLSYAFDPPNPSPRVYPLGPLTMGGFHESRQWELAADATKVWIGSGADANWSTSGNWSPSGAPASGDTIVFDGSAGGSPDNNSTWDASAQASMTSLTISTYSGTLTISVTSPTLTGAFSDTSTNGLTFTGALALSVGGDFTLTTSGTVTPNTSTVTLTGTSNTLNSSKNLYNLTYNPASTGTMTMATNDFSVTNVLDVEANGTLSLNSSRTLTLSLTSGSALTLNGTISGSGTLYYQTTTTFPSGGTLSSALTLNVSNGNITMSARTLGGAVKITSATSTGGSIIPASGSLTITGALTVDASSTGDTRFDNRTNNATVSVGGASCTSGGTKRILMGTSSNTSTGDFNLANCNTTSDFGSNSTLTMSGATTNLNLSSTGPTTLVISAAGTVTLTGGATPTNLTTNSGATLAFGSQTLSMSGTFTSNGTASGSSGLLIYQSTTNWPATGTVSVPVRLDDRNGNITVTSGTTFGGDVTVFNGGTSAARSVILGGATTFQGALTINAPTSQNSTLDGGTNNPAVSVTGDFTFSKGSTGLPSWTTGTGTWTFSGAVNLTNGTVTITSGNTIAMNAGSTKTLTTASNTLQHLTISGAATLGDATAIAGNLDMTGGTVTANSQTVTLSGTSNTVTGGSNTLYNVTLSGSASYTLQTSNLTISNILTVAAGTTWNINSTIFTFLTLNSATNSLSLNSTGTIGGSGTISYASATSNAFPTVGTVNATVRYDATNGNLNAVSRTYGGGIEAYSNSTSARSVFVGTATGQTISETTLSVNANNTASVTLDASNGGTYNNVISASSNFSCTKGSTGAPTIITGTGNWTISGNTDFTNCTVTATATNNLIMNGTGGKTLTGGSATLANLQITSANDTVTLQTTSLTVNTLLTIANTSTLSINSSITLTLSGNSGTTFTNTGTCSGAGQIIYQNSATTFPSGGGSVNCAVRLDALNGNMSVPARTFGGALDLYSNTANARTITPGTAGSQTITVSGALTFTTGSSQTQLFTIAGATNSPAMNVTGDFSTTKSGSGSMTFTTGAGTWTMSGAVNFSNITTLTAATNNLFVLNGSSKTLTGNSKTLYQLQISGDTTASGALTVSNLLTVDANKTYTLSGTVTLSATSGTSLTLNGTIGGTSVLIYRTTTAFPTSGTINSQLRMDCGQVANSVLILSARTYGGTVLPYDTTTNNCTVQLGTAGSQTLTLSAGFTPTNTSTGVLTVDGSTWNPAVTISGDFTTNTGNSPTFNAGTGTWTVSGNVDWAGGGPLTYTAGTGNTFTINGASITLTSNGDTFYNLTISSAVTLADSFTVANNLDLTSSTLDATTNLTTVTMTWRLPT